MSVTAKIKNVMANRYINTEPKSTAQILQMWYLKTKAVKPSHAIWKEEVFFELAFA